MNELVVQNPDATVPLRLAIDLICNTPEEKILSNVMINSIPQREWICLCEPHDRIAVICGSGPSLADCIPEIEAHQKEGHKLFALNGAALFLNNKNIIPDYQVIMDAQPRTIEVLGSAKAHLLASQVDPSLFHRLPDAILWHATYGNRNVDEQDGFSAQGKDYCLIGSFSSVGNTALILLNAMGYRHIHIYGMDSSHKDGEGHAAHQAINDDDICTRVEFGGKSYISSLTMKLQASGFMARANDLMRNGCVIEVHGTGLLPDMWHARPKSEKEKYQSMWGFKEYRTVSPGEEIIDIFLDVAKPDGLIIDYGCGTGRGALALKNKGFNVFLLDFTDNSRDEAAANLPFMQWDLTEIIPISAPYGYCTDVLEHIPPKDVENVLRNITNSAERVFFQISTVPDGMGSLIGADLHLTVQPHSWWADVFDKINCRIIWQREESIASLFYVEKAKS